MSRILENIRNVDPNDSDAIKENISAFFQNLPKHTDVQCNIWLCVLESIITRFPRFCAQHRSTIENHIVNFLDSSNYYNVVEAAKCAHGLQQIRPSQDKTATAKNCWREQMSILCNTTHKLIEEIFSRTINIYKDNKNVKKLPTSLLSNTPLTTALTRILDVKKTQMTNADDKNLVLSNKLRNMFVFIQAMLVEVYPVAKPIQPQLILEVIVQALSVSSSANTKVTEAAIVKIQALRTLDAMITCLGPNLIPFSAVVFRCVMQTLRWSSDNPNEESRKVRCTAYNSLSRWLSTLHVHRVSADGKSSSFEDEITNHIVTDITPLKKYVQLTMSNQYTKNLSKKARRKLANNMLQQSSISSHMPGEKNKTTVVEEISDEVANAALECLETLFTVCGIFLKPATHKIFQERLVRECYSLDSYSTSRSTRLLRALDACRKNTPPNVPPPTQYLLHLYSTLINSPCDEIKKFSSQAILEIRLHLHCSPPSLNFALEPSVQKKRTEDKRKRISEKNRAALEALLGRERVPQPDDEVISIPDEPSNKKLRLDSAAIADNISVSSESNKSIEISDEDVDDDVILEVEPESEHSQSKIEERSSQPESLKNLEINVGSKENNVMIINEDTVRDTSRTSPYNVPSQSEITPETNIHEAETQIPLNTLVDTEEVDNSQVSMEIVYDLNAEKNVKVLEKIEDENLPSTNDTDDVQITCGQTIQNSQELDPDKNIEVESMPKENGINYDDNVEVVLENGNKNEVIENIEVKITTKEIIVDEMLADFIDDVNEESTTEA